MHAHGAAWSVRPPWATGKAALRESVRRQSRTAPRRRRGASRAATGVAAALNHAPPCMQKGDLVQAGAACGRVRRCSGSLGEEVDNALPSTAVSVVGLDAVPAAGDVFRVWAVEADAREAAAVRPACMHRACMRLPRTPTCAQHA
jgi:hypothetical protein